MAKSDGRLRAVVRVTLIAGLIGLAVVTAGLVTADVVVVRPGQSVLLDGDGRIWRVEDWPRNGFVAITSGNERARVSLHRVHPIDRWGF